MLENFEFRLVLEKVVFNVLKSFKRNKFFGFDNFFFGMLKDFVDIIVKFFMYIINLFFVIGFVFIDWKVVKIVLFFKFGLMVEIDNYRFILIFFLMLKILEKVVFK